MPRKKAPEIKKTVDPNVVGLKAEVISQPITETLEQNYMPYAMSVIVSRAIPEIDGFKPSHRKLLYTMYKMNLLTGGRTKSANIVGQTMRLNPHGDAAIYETMVRLSKGYGALLTPFVDSKGNFGKVFSRDMSYAASRYTEAKLAPICAELFGDIDSDTVDFVDNYDGSMKEPTLLPTTFPNVLVSANMGIAVGMATNIPPHNLGEVIDGVICMIDNPDCTIDDLMQHIKGPDFPTGGIILGRRGIREAYYTGHGRIEVRAKTNIEEMPNGRSRIVVTEIPYQVNKAKLVEKIAELVHDKRIEGISDIRDESDRQGMRIVIELKKDVYPQVILNTLYKHTSMQETFGANMLALVNGQPKILSLRDMVYYYLEHQKDVVTRRTRFDLNKALARAHILEGLLKALDHIDEIVSIIRASKDPNTAKTTLMERFDFSDKQAQAILDMRLARLTGLERDRLQQEYDDLEKEIARFQAILADEHLLMEVIKTEISAIRDKFADPRRTELTTIDGEIDVEDLIQEEDMVVTLTRQGYVKRTPKSIYRAQNRGGRGVTGMTTKEEDFAVQMRVVSTHDEIMFFTNMGRVYMLKCYQIPEAGRTARGTAIINLIQIASDEKVTCMVPVPGATGEHNLVMATRDGMIKKTPYSEFANLRKNGLIAINLKEGDELIGVDLTSGDDEILLGSRKGMAIRFSERHIRPMGRASMGVKSMRLDDDDIIIDMVPLEQGADVLAITTLGYGKRTSPDEYREQGRNGKGIIATKLTDKTGDLAALLMVKPDEDLMLITDDGTIIRTRAEDIRVCGRNTQGVIVMKLQEGSHVIAVARAERDEEPDAPANAADADAAEARAEGFDTSDAAESKAVQELLRRAEEDANGSDLDMDLGGEDEKDSPADDEDIRVLSEFYAAALSGLTALWLQNGMKYDTDAYIDHLGHLLDGNIRRALERSCQDSGQA